jgi:tripartite-type tricarboxylate transporter receptor subunit TctC
VVVEIRAGAGTIVPIIAEAGVPGFEAVQWSGMLAPAGTPRKIIAILRAPEARERLAGDSAEMVASSPEEFAAFMKLETVKWAKVAKAAGIQPE